MGDFDVDGVCATFILKRGLRALGADVDNDIPDWIIDYFKEYNKSKLINYILLY